MDRNGFSTGGPIGGGGCKSHHIPIFCEELATTGAPFVLGFLQTKQAFPANQALMQQQRAPLAGD